MKTHLILIQLLLTGIASSAAVPSVATLPASDGTNYAVQFDGVDDRVQAPTNAFPFVENWFTIELWANPTATRGLTTETNAGISGFGSQRFAVFPDHGDFGYGVFQAGVGLSIGSNGISVYEHGINHLPSVLVYSGAISGWTHVALVYQNGSPRLYVNGVPVRTGSPSRMSQVHPSASLGGSVQGIGYGNYQGQLDEVRIWSAPLSQDQIQTNMHRRLIGNENNLVVYYRCDEGSGATLGNRALELLVPRGELANGAAFVFPSVELEGPLSGTKVLLNGVANPNGTSTRAWFEWGTTTNYGNATPPQAIGSGNLSIQFSQFLSNLLRGVPYHFRAVASNSLGIALGGNQSFSPPVFVNISADLRGVSRSSVAWGDYDKDGDLDILLTGETSSAASYLARVYRNNGNGIFTDLNANLPGVSEGSVAWGDYDNDGDLDILLTGRSSAASIGAISRAYRNDGNGTFTDLNAGLPGVSEGSVAWGDYDNDGDLDILLTGYNAGSGSIAQVYRNNGNGTFTDLNAGLPGVYRSSVAWGDYDNDGDLDILLTGYKTGSVRIASIYRNDGNGTFTDLNAGLPGVSEGSVAWGDYDNDGDLDILLTGDTDVGPVTRVYRNNGNGTFVEINAGLPGVGFSSAVWGDYDNDGDLDILLTGLADVGPVARVYRNEGDRTFTDLNVGLPGVSGSSAAWGDYDNDGDLDILLSGASRFFSIAQVWRNHTLRTNTLPNAPTGLTVVMMENQRTAILSWNAATDAQTPVAGLTYNMRVGTTPGASDVMGPMASAAGVRRLPQMGNVQQGLTASLPYNFDTPYYWSVQAVDAAFAGSAFASEANFRIHRIESSVITPATVVNIPLGDFNGDGVVDQNELNTVLSHYFPTSPFLQMTNVAGLGGTNVTFALTNSTVGAFSVEYTTDFMDWLFLGPATLRYEFTDTNAPAEPQRYYRLRWP